MGISWWEICLGFWSGGSLGVSDKMCFRVLGTQAVPARAGGWEKAMSVSVCVWGGSVSGRGAC